MILRISSTLYNTLITMSLLNMLQNAHVILMTNGIISKVLEIKDKIFIHNVTRIIVRERMEMHIFLHDLQVHIHVLQYVILL